MTAVLRLRNGLRPAHQGPENPLLCRLRNNLLARSREVRHDYMLSKPPHSDLTSRTVITDVIIGAQEADLSSCCDAAAFSNCSSMQLESEMPMSVGIPRVDQACIIDVEGTSETRVRSQRRLMRHNRCALEATARRERPNWMSNCRAKSSIVGSKGVRDLLNEYRRTRYDHKISLRSFLSPRMYQSLA